MILPLVLLAGAVALDPDRSTQRRRALAARLLTPTPPSGPTPLLPELDLLERPRDEVRPPRMFRVVLHNDARMSGDVVLESIVRCFRKPAEEAMRVMLAAHRGGSASVGIYTREVAETRVACAETFSRDEMERLFGLRNTVRLEVVPEERMGSRPITGCFQGGLA